MSVPADSPRTPSEHALGSVIEVLRERRKELGLSQADLARRLGHTQAWLSYVEQEERAPSLHDLDRLCRELGVSVTLGAGANRLDDGDPLDALRGQIQAVREAAAPLGGLWGAAWHERETLRAGDE